MNQFDHAISTRLTYKVLASPKTLVPLREARKGSVAFKQEEQGQIWPVNTVFTDFVAKKATAPWQLSLQQHISQGKLQVVLTRAS
jgi:hypothetical protein